jgi:hypothetical protein
MDKKITALLVLFFFLFTLAYGETGWIKPATGVKKSTRAAENTDTNPDCDDGEHPSDAEEEDTSKTRETDDREMDEYESTLAIFFLLPANPLLNSQYTYQHLLFKEHHIESAVPPPRN